MRELWTEVLKIILSSWPAELLAILLWHTLERVVKGNEEREKIREKARYQLIRGDREIRERARVRRWARSLEKHN